VNNTWCPSDQRSSDPQAVYDIHRGVLLDVAQAQAFGGIAAREAGVDVAGEARCAGYDYLSNPRARELVEHVMDDRPIGHVLEHGRPGRPELADLAPDVLHHDHPSELHRTRTRMRGCDSRETDERTVTLTVRIDQSREVPCRRDERLRSTPMDLGFTASGRARRTRRLVLFASVFTVIGGCLVSESLSSSVARSPMARERSPATGWAPCNRNARNRTPSTFRPLSDARAAGLVTHQIEDRRYNARPFSLDGRSYAAANYYVPTTIELRRFHNAHTSLGEPVVQLNPYFRDVDGLDGLRRPSTDDLIQWAAHKWGIPENWLRAEFVQESYWNQFQLGDRASVIPRWYHSYPPQARVPGSDDVYQSLGITQVKWAPDGSVGAGSEPLRWKSTAFNLDYQAAMVRFYFDNPQGARSSWGDRTYVPCQAWNSIGGWFEPYPWRNPGQESYIRQVRQDLADVDWTAASFVHWTPHSFPPGIRFK